MDGSMVGWMMYYRCIGMIMIRRNEEILQKRMRMIYSDELSETFTVPPVMRIHTCESDAHNTHCETQIYCHSNTNKPHMKTNLKTHSQKQTPTHTGTHANKYKHTQTVKHTSHYCTTHTTRNYGFETS